MKRMRIAQAILFIVIMCVAAFFRLHDLGKLPGSLYIDEVAIAVDARSIVDTGKDMHKGPWFTPIFPSYGDYKLPVYIWLTVASMKLFGVNDFVVRFPSTLAGIGTVVLIYAITLELLQKEKHRIWYALSAAGMVAILPWSIHFSRTAFEAHVGQFLVLAALWCALQGKKRSVWYVISAAVGALAVYTYYSVRFVFPPLFLITYFMQEKWSVKKIIGVLGGSMILFLLLLYPMSRSVWASPMQAIRLSTRHVLDIAQSVNQSNTLREMSGNDVISKLVYHRYVMMGKELVSHYFDHMGLQYLFIFGDANMRHGTGEVGIMLLGMMPFFMMGLYMLVSRFPRIALILGVWFIFGLLPASVPYDTPHALRSLNVLGVYGIILGVGFGSFVMHKHVWMRALGVLGSLIILMNFIAYWHDYTSHYPQRSEYMSWAMSKKLAAEFIRDNMDEKQEVRICANDKFFLWVAWYARIPSSVVQHAPEQDFMKQSLRHITFDPNVKIDPNKKNILYVAEASRLQDNPESNIIIESPAESFRYVEVQ